MENFEELDIKGSYDSEEDQVLNDFYIPVLQNSKKYWRLAGYFTSSSLAVAARGMSQFILNGGKMRLVTGARLNPDDVEAIVSGKEDTESLIGRKFVEDLENLKDEITKDAVGALAWMVSRGNLDIKIAIVYGSEGLPLEHDKIVDEFLFHSKVGICFDDYGNVLSFSGSINETMNAWLNNIENFKVFKGWIDRESKYLDDDIRMFEKYWSGSTTRANIIDLPNEAYQEFIKRSPPSIDRININSLNEPVPTELETGKQFGIKDLREYQKKAMNNFMERGHGFLEMATGTGKTFTALGIIQKLIEREKHLGIVITCPLIHLMDDPWKTSLDQFGIPHTKISGSVRNWRTKLERKISQLNLKHLENLVIVTTHDTSSTADFVEMVEKIKTKKLIVADEVHGMGSSGRLEGLSYKYDYRLGLSATPRRWMDDEGTQHLEEFFGDTVYEFPLNRAIREGYLCEYEYIPHFVDLNAQELADYRDLSRSAAAAYSMARNSRKHEKIYLRLLNKRSEIIRGAEAKLDVLSSILSKMGEVSHCLIYTTYSQREDVLKVARKQLDLYHQFTFRENQEERRRILSHFEVGDYQALIAENCLDEGVDVPSTRTAIIMASTGNPRQYIQRRGRVLRKHPSKKNAVIHDILVIPEVHRRDISFELERKLVKKEIARYLEFAESSLNPAKTLKTMQGIKRRFNL